MSTIGDAALDLLLGGACAGCRAPGRALCARCHERLAPTRGVLRPVPAEPVPVPCLAAGWYDDVLRSVVLAHKERGVVTLARPLGTLLAAVVVEALAGVAADGVPVVVVPVPSRRGATRRRGHDPTGSIAREAARRVAGRGRVAVVPLLRLRPGVVDQAGLGVTGRRDNLRGAMALRASGPRRLRRLGPRVRLVVVDDVLTSGATVAEACAALARHGLDVHAVATVAATPRRTPGAAPAVHGQSSG